MMSMRCRGLLLSLSVVALAAGPLLAAEPAAPASFPVPPEGFDRPRDGVEKGKVERVEYDAPALGADVKRWMQIYTPPGYTKEKKYPVFYLIHGAGQDERTWVNEGQANVILDNLLADKKIVPMIVVFPNGGVGGGGRGGAGRGGAGRGAAGAATAPAGTAPAQGRRGGGAGGGGGGGFEADLVRDIIPYVESHYAAIPDAQQRALAGLSMGGMQTKAIAPGNSDKFAYFGIFSGGNIAPATEIPDMDAFKKNVKLVYMSFGSREPSNARGSNPLPSGPVGIQREAEAFNRAGVKAVYYVSPNSAHDFTSWKRSLYYMSQLLFQEQPKP